MVDGDLTLDDMFEVFEAADKAIADEEVAPGSAGAAIAEAVGGGFVTTESGVQYLEEVIGRGETTNPGGFATVHLVGRTYVNGQADREFVNTRKQGQPYKIVIGGGKNNIINGLDSAVEGMRIGGKRTCIIPPSVAYAGQDKSEEMIAKLPPNSDIRVECELLEVGSAGTGSIEVAAEGLGLYLRQLFKNKAFAFTSALLVASLFVPRDLTFAQVKAFFGLTE